MSYENNFKYRIIGQHRNYPGIKDVYWEGDSLKEGLTYLNELKLSTALCNIKFKFIKESEEN